MIQVRSFKLRLTLWYALMLTVFLAGFAFFMYAELSRALYRDVEQSMRGEVRNIEDALLTFFLETRDPRLLMLPRAEKGVLTFPPEYQEVLAKTVLEFERRQRRIVRSLLLVRIVGLDHSIVVSNLEGWGREIIFPNYVQKSVHFYPRFLNTHFAWDSGKTERFAWRYKNAFVRFWMAKLR